MYLKEFKDEKTKEAIIDLCLYAALANSTLDKSEEALIKEFCDEIGHTYYEKPTGTLESAQKVIADSCGTSARKKILMELLAIVMADGSCDDEEKKYLQSIASEWELESNLIDEFYRALSQLYMIYANINSLVS